MSRMKTLDEIATEMIESSRKPTNHEDWLFRHGYRRSGNYTEQNKLYYADFRVDGWTSWKKQAEKMGGWVTQIVYVRLDKGSCISRVRCDRCDFAKRAGCSDKKRLALAELNGSGKFSYYFDEPVYCEFTGSTPEEAVRKALGFIYDILEYAKDSLKNYVPDDMCKTVSIDDSIADSESRVPFPFLWLTRHGFVFDQNAGSLGINTFEAWYGRKFLVGGQRVNMYCILRDGWDAVSMVRLYGKHRFSEKWDYDHGLQLFCWECPVRDNNVEAAVRKALKAMVSYERKKKE